MRASERRRYLEEILLFLGLIAILVPVSGCADRTNSSAASCVISGDTSGFRGGGSSSNAFARVLPGYLPYAAVVPLPKEQRAAGAMRRDRAECGRVAREALARNPNIQPGKSCACDVVSATHEFVPSADDQTTLVCGNRILYFSEDLGLSNVYGYPLVAVCTANSPNVTLHLDALKAPTLLPEQCRKELRTTCPLD
jgi:hypothetical protein